MKTIIDFIKDNESVIDNKYFSVFWKLITQKNEHNENVFGFYLSPNIITQTIGYKRASNFINDVLRPNYIINVDYIEINKNDELVKQYNALFPIKR